MPVVTAFPRVIASDDESDIGDVSLSNTEVRLLEGGVVSDKDTALERSVTLRNRGLMTLLVMVMMPMMLRLQQGRADPRRGQRRKTKSKKEFSLKGGRISMIEYLEENSEVWQGRPPCSGQAVCQGERWQRKGQGWYRGRRQR